MSPKDKERALLRYFSSEEYIRDFHKNYEIFWQHLITAMDVFENNLPSDYSTWENKEKIDIWHERVLVRHTKPNKFEMEISKYLQGEESRLSGITSNYSVLMANIPNWMVMKWLDYIDPIYKENWVNSFGIAGGQASNINWTISDDWEDDEILDEDITGPIDENILKKYLK